MFIMIGSKRCPTCGVQGRKWKRKPEVLICPECSAFFNEFGFIIEPQSEKKVLFT